MLNSANTRSFPTVIANSNGELQNLDFQVGNKRSPENIKLFAKMLVTSLYTWRSYLPGESAEPDPGMNVGKGTIPTATYRASLALEPEFGKAYRESLSQLKEILANRGSNRVEAVYIVQEIGQPESIGEGRWTIKVIGTQLIANNKGSAAIPNPINLQLTLKAIPPPILSETEKQYKDPGIAKQVRDSLALGLQVTNITDLTKN
jgi:hypothetical protein